MAQDVRSDVVLPPKHRPKVYVVDDAVFAFDAESAACLLSDHDIWATPVGVRPARNKSPEHSLPCVLSPEQATLVLRRDVADVFLGPPRHDAKEQSKNNQPIPAAGIRTSAWDGVDGRPPEAQGAESGAVKINWPYPATAEEMRSMTVFRDLWGRGLCVADGSKYGADYVVYHGPPTESHSVAAVLVSRGPSGGELSPAELSGFARVQQSVAKRAIFATPPLTLSEEGYSNTGSGSKAPKKKGFHNVSRSAGLPGEGKEYRGDVRYVTLQFDSVSARTL